MMDKIIKNAFIDAIGTTIYIILVVAFIYFLQGSMLKENNILIPIAMLLLFVCSAAITGFLVFGKPIMMYLDGKKKEAIWLVSLTLVVLLIITIIVFILLLIYSVMFVM